MVACKYPQVRNWETGRCKTPCRADQAVNPDTGRCVTKTYLKALHIRGDLGTSEYRSSLRDDGITRRDGRSRRTGGTRRLTYGTRDELSEYLGEDVDFTEYDYKEPSWYRRLGWSGYSRRDNAKDLRDMLVDDPNCYPRKRNLLTGRCKTPCPPGYAINPRTKQCVTIEYLISIDLYDPWYIEDEEDYMAANLKWFPSDLQTLARHDNADMKRLIGHSKLGVADLKTLRGINQSGPGHQLFGIYSPAHRTACDLSIIRSLIGSNLSNCGLRRVVQFGQPPPLPAAPPGVAAIPGNPPTVNEILAELRNHVGQDFIFMTGQVINMATFSSIFAAFVGRDMKIALVDQGGVWRLIHRNTGAAQVALPPPALFQANISDSKKLAEALDNHWKNSVSVTFHPWDTQTSFDVITIFNLEISTKTKEDMAKGMYVVKRDGRKEDVQFDKITARIKNLCKGLDMDFVDPVAVTMKVNQGIFSGVSTTELDELAAQTCAYMSTNHPDYSILAARICLSNLYKETESDFLVLVQKLRSYVHPLTVEPAPLVSAEVVDVVQKYSSQIQAALDEKMESYDFFAFKTLEKSYLLKMHGKVAERPHQLLMRVSIGIHGDDLDNILKTYHMMADKKFTMATPTLFNSGTPCPQMSSCFLMTMKEDSIGGIYDTLKNCAMISKYAGGIGVSVHDVRASNSYIRGTNGTSNGLVPMLRVFNNTARYVDQGGGRRKGSIAVYLEPWHADVESFLDLRKNQGNELERARDLFYALWVPDLFMKRVEANSQWSLFCPNEAPGMSDVYGADFDELYESYESRGLARKTMPARDLWDRILDTQVETGTPYILFKDAANSKSNQKHLGIIKSSNLCTEIMEYTDKDEIAVCNLASINLAAMVVDAYKFESSFDFDLLQRTAEIVTDNLNKVIDRNFYPVVEARNSNMRHRPIGIGIQGLADAFIMLRLPFDSPQASELNKKIFETIYYGAMKASMSLSKEVGPHESFRGSPLSKGQFQFDLWGVDPSERYGWDDLRSQVIKHGVRNSLLVAPMPTASTAQILGNNESFEPFTSNVYTRRVLAGEFAVVNKHLLKDLTGLGIWNDDLKEKLLKARGSVQDIPGISAHLKKIYKTVWEIPQRVILDQAADRGPFVCQSQSTNIHMAEPSRGKLTSMFFYGWKKGLKTGMYYLRTRPKADSIQFAVDKTTIRNSSVSQDSQGSEEEECLTCSA